MESKSGKCEQNALVLGHCYVTEVVAVTLAGKRLDDQLIIAILVLICF